MSPFQALARRAVDQNALSTCKSYAQVLAPLISISNEQASRSPLMSAPIGAAYASQQLRDAARDGNIAEVASIIDSWRGAGLARMINEPGASGWTPAIYASQYDHVDILEMLHENGASLECKSRSGFTPLIFASTKDSLRCLEYLLIKGHVDRNVRNDNGYNALDMCVSIEARNLLTASPPPPPTSEAEAEAAAAAITQTTTAEASSSSSASSTSSPAIPDADVAKDIRYAASYGTTGYLSLIVDKWRGHMVLDERDRESGYAAVHLAAIKGHLLCLKILAEGGARINLRSANEGFSPLMLAIHNEDEDVADQYWAIEFLLKRRDVMLDLQGNDGETPFSLCKTERTRELLREAVAAR